MFLWKSHNLGLFGGRRRLPCKDLGNRRLDLESDEEGRRRNSLGGRWRPVNVSGWLLRFIRRQRFGDSRILTRDSWSKFTFKLRILVVQLVQRQSPLSIRNYPVRLRSITIQCLCGRVTETRDFQLIHKIFWYII
jgi:hypothetical protein